MTAEEILNTVTCDGMRELTKARAIQALEEYGKQQWNEAIEGRKEENTYTETDMKEFAEWCSESGYKYHYDTETWERYNYENSSWDESKTTSDILKKWRNRNDK